MILILFNWLFLGARQLFIFTIFLLDLVIFLKLPLNLKLLNSAFVFFQAINGALVIRKQQIQLVQRDRNILVGKSLSLVFSEANTVLVQAMK